MTTSAAAPAAAPTSPTARSPNTMAAEAIADATQRLAARRGRSTDPSNKEKENDGAGQFPNGTGSEWGGGAAPGAGGAAAGMAGTGSGSKSDRTEEDNAETGGGGGFPLLAVASGSADSATNTTNTNTGSGKSNVPSGGTQVRGGGTDSGGSSVLLGLAVASPNTLEGGIRGGIGSIGTGTAGGAFANTVKRRRRGGETTTDGNTMGGGSNNIRLFSFDEEEDGVADGEEVEGGLGGLGGAVVGKTSDAEDRLEQIWKELQQQQRGNGGDPNEHNPEYDDGDDASTTLLASPSTVHTAGTFDTAATDHTTGTATSTTTTHRLYADLTTAALSQTESLLLAEVGGLIARGVQAHHDRDAAVRELDLRKELADGRGREVQRLQESERQSRETISVS